MREIWDTSPMQPDRPKVDTDRDRLRAFPQVPTRVDPMADPTPAVVQKTGTADSIKTTIAGILAALGLAGEQLQSEGWPEDIGGWIMLLLKVVGPVLLGFFARDKNVSSEGRKIVSTPSIHQP